MSDDEAELRAAILRYMAGRARVQAAAFDTAAAAVKATAAVQRFTEAIIASEAREVAEHPDLAELNVQLDGFYGAAGSD